jgi:hypothetical protein
MIARATLVAVASASQSSSPSFPRNRRLHWRTITARSRRNPFLFTSILFALAILASPVLGHSAGKEWPSIVEHAKYWLMAHDYPINDQNIMYFLLDARLYKYDDVTNGTFDVNSYKRNYLTKYGHLPTEYMR